MSPWRELSLIHIFYAMKRMPLDAIPDLSDTQVIVYSRWDRSPDKMCIRDRAYAMLYLSRHAIHIFEENVDLMRQFSKVAEAKYAVGKASQSDALKAQVELSKMMNELVTLRQEKETNTAMLNTLLNRPPEAPLGFPMDPDPRTLKKNLSDLEVLALESRPELRGAAIAVDKSGTQVALSRSEYLPDIMLCLLYTSRCV